MKTASSLLQLVALLACFLAHQTFSDEMAGVRPAVETTAGKYKSSLVVAGAVAGFRPTA